MTTLIEGKTDKRLYGGLFITLGASMIMPEYIAPFFVFGLYIHFIRHFKSTGRNARMGELGKIFLIYTGYMLLSAIWSKTHIFSALIALLWMGCLLAFIEVANIITSKSKLDGAILAMSISAGIIGLIAIFEFASFNMTRYISWFHFLFPNPLYYEFNDVVFRFIPVDIINYRFRSRSSASFDNPLILATYMVMATPFCAYGAAFFKDKKAKAICIISLIFALGGIVGTSSRASYIAIILAIGVMLISNKKLLKKLLPIIAVLVVGIPIGLIYRFRNLSLNDFLASDTQRFDIWKACLDMFKSSPIIGLGAGTDNIHTLLINEYGIARPHAHNLFIQMLVEGGVIGIGFVLVIVVMTIKCIVKLYKIKGGKYKNYACIYAASLVAFTMMSMTEFTLQSAKELMMLFFVLGFTQATLRLATDDIQPAPDEIVYEELEEEIAPQTV